MFHNELIIKLICALIYLAILSVAASFLAIRFYDKGRVPWGVTLLMAVFLSAITILYLQSHTFFRQEVTVPAQISKLKDAVNPNSSQYKDYRFITEHFILINTSTNPQFVRDYSKNLEDSAFSVITDRPKLIRLLHFL